MSMMVSFVLSFFPRDVLDEILNLIESVSEDFPSYSKTSITSFHLFSFFYYQPEVDKKQSVQPLFWRTILLKTHGYNNM